MVLEAIVVHLFLVNPTHKKMYINGIGNIACQILEPRSRNNQFLLTQGNRKHVTDFDYKTIIPPMQLRRMSKVVKMGIAASQLALKDADCSMPHIITTGTAYGCLADTEAFLEKIIEYKETMLTPTAFIQSTHNTVSGQIALMLGCHGHNFTFVHRGHSFESALLETKMLLAEKENLNILCGATEEGTQYSFDIIERFGSYKKENESFEDKSDGTIAGEGAHMMLISNQKTENSYAYVKDVLLCNDEAIPLQLKHFLENNNLTPQEIDICMIGANGDRRYDPLIQDNIEILQEAKKIHFKKWCGEYPVSSAFAMNVAAVLLKNQQCVDDTTGRFNDSINTIKNILIYNHYKNGYHTLILLQAL